MRDGLYTSIYGRAIKMKLGAIDYVGEGNREPTFSNNWITGVFPQIDEI